MPVPTAVAVQEQKNAAGGARDASAASAEPPRLRQYFPETMLWLPEAVTDEQGMLHLDVPVADSITTWRVTALASSQDGRLGHRPAALQDFSSTSTCRLLTVGGDRRLGGVYNYLP
jgi:uncharacterized protein YfaS (alpha-2-macroglobulin family)